MPATSAATAPAAAPAEALVPASVQSPSDVRALAKPPVRKLAKDLGIDLATLVGSGADGVITRADVEAAAGRCRTDTLGARCSEPAGAAAAGERETREPVKGVRKMMAQAMVGSAFTGAPRHRVDHRRRDRHDGARRRG